MEGKRKVNSSNLNNPITILGHGCKGLFVTSDRNKEGLAVKEIYRLLEEYYDNIHEESETKEQDTMNLDDELASLTNKNKPKLFSRLDLGMKGISFICILDDSIEPVEAVKYIIHKVKETKISSTRFAARIIPIQYSCYAHVEEVAAILKKEIPAIFTEGMKGKSWFCDVKRRNNDTFDKDALIREISPLINGDDFPTNLRGGDICIHVDVNKGICGISIITDYPSLNSLSLRTLLDEKEKEKKEKVEKKVDLVNVLDRDWKCGKCGSPNFKQNDICWKCQFNRRS